jgi:hypothetical protein
MVNNLEGICSRWIRNHTRFYNKSRCTKDNNTFPELEEEDIDEVICSYEEELNNEDLLELTQNQHYDKFQDEVSEKPNEKVLTVKGLSKAFKLIKEGLQIINDEDSYHERLFRLSEMF